MGKTAKGGANYFHVFTVDATHANIGANAVFVGQLNEQTAFNRDETGLFKINITQLQDDSVSNAFLETYAPVTEQTGGEDATLEDGTIEGGATAASPSLLFISYGPSNTEATPKRKIFASIVKMSTTSGSSIQKNGTFSRPTMEAVAQKTLNALDIETKFLTSMCENTTTATLGASTKGKYIFQNLT